MAYGRPSLTTTSGTGKEPRTQGGRKSVQEKKKKEGTRPTRALGKWLLFASGITEGSGVRTSKAKGEEEEYVASERL